MKVHTRIIISRHAAAVEFIRASSPEWADAPVLAEASPRDVAGRDIAGNIPLHLAAAARSVAAIEFIGTAPRGAEYTLDEMRAAGATMRRYVVRSAHDNADLAERCARRAEQSGTSAFTAAAIYQEIAAG